MVDPLSDPLLTPTETAGYLRIPLSTVYGWLSENAAGEPLVHQVPARRHGWPSVPFVAVVEAYVLRSLRDLGLTKRAIRDAATAVRQEFHTPYALASRRIATDGVDIFVEYAPATPPTSRTDESRGEVEIYRASDRQLAFRETIQDYLRFISWDTAGELPVRLRLRQFPDSAPVIIDPRFGWGAPVLEESKVPVSAIVSLWKSGEPLEAVAEEFEITRDVVESICRVAA